MNVHDLQYYLKDSGKKGINIENLHNTHYEKPLKYKEKVVLDIIVGSKLIMNYE